MGDEFFPDPPSTMPFQGDSRLKMDIACPTCATTYEIDDGTVAETGRKVRCAGCGTIWRTYRDKAFELISAPVPQELAPQAFESVAAIADPPPMAPSEDDIAAEPSEAAMRTEDFALDAADSAAAADDGSDAASPRKAKLVKDKPAKAGLRGGALRRLISLPVLAAAGVAALAAIGFGQRERVVRLLPQSAAIFAAVGAPVNLRGIDIRDVKSRMVEDNGVSVLVIDGKLVSVAKDRVSVPRMRFAVLGANGEELYVWSAQADRQLLQPGEAMSFRRRLAAPPGDGREVSVRFLSASDITAGLK
jgi:predicted Zn finger-like uncharacterized protein